jgi:hypothetical protein
MTWLRSVQRRYSMSPDAQLRAANAHGSPRRERRSICPSSTECKIVRRVMFRLQGRVVGNWDVYRLGAWYTVSILWSASTTCTGQEAALGHRGRCKGPAGPLSIGQTAERGAVSTACPEDGWLFPGRGCVRQHASCCDCAACNSSCRNKQRSGRSSRRRTGACSQCTACCNAMPPRQMTPVQRTGQAKPERPQKLLLPSSRPRA